MSSFVNTIGAILPIQNTSKYNGRMGVYIILVDTDNKICRRSEDVEMRFNMGYGNICIAPKNPKIEDIRFVVGFQD